MNTKLAISLLTDSQNSLTKSLAGLGLLTNGENITSLLAKVDQSEKAAVSQYKQLSGKVDVLNVNINTTNDALALAAADNKTSQDRLLAFKKDESELINALKNLADKNDLFTKNANSKKAEIKTEIEGIKKSITATEVDIAKVKQQIQDGLGLVANYNQLTAQYQTAQDKANYHAQYVQYWGVIGRERGRSGKTKDIWGWVTNGEQVRLRDQSQQQANQFKQQVDGLQASFDAFNKNLPILQATQQSKTTQIFLYEQDLAAKNNLLSLSSIGSSNELESINLEISQKTKDLQQLQKIDIPAQEKVAQATKQRVTDVQTALDKIKADGVVAKKQLDDFVNNNQDLLATNVSLDSLKGQIDRVSGAIANLQGQLTKPNQSADVLKGLNQDLGVQQGKLDQLKQHYQLLALEASDVNQQRLLSFNSQLATENAVKDAIATNSIASYANLLPELIDQFKGLTDVWVESLKKNHKLTVDIGKVFQDNLTAFNQLTDYIEKNLATVDSNYSLAKIRLNEAIAKKDAHIKRSDALAKTVDDLGEAIELHQKSVAQGKDIAAKLEHLQNLTTYEKQSDKLSLLESKLPDIRQLQQQLVDLQKKLIAFQREKLNYINTANANNAVTNTITGHMYFLTPARNWSDAQAIAKTAGGDLITINNQEEFQWVMGKFSQTQFWIGLHDSGQEGVWQWVNGEAVTYTNWLPGQPDNTGNNEDFVHMNWKGDGRWNDLPHNWIIPGLVEVAVPLLNQKEASIFKEIQQATTKLNQTVDDLLKSYDPNAKLSGAKTADNLQAFISQAQLAVRPKLVTGLVQEVNNKIVDIPNQLDLPNDQQEQAIETGLQKYIKQKQNDIATTQSQQLASLQKTFRQPTRALYFDGVNDHINVGINPSLKVTTNFTLEAWIKPQQKGNNGIIVGREGEYLLSVGSDNKIYYAVASANPTWTWIASGYKVSLNQWTHIAFTFDNGEIKLYANGGVLVYDYHGSGALGDADANQNEVRIGNRQYANSELFKGEIDEVRIWNVTRTQAEIEGAYNRSLTGKEQGLAGYWNLDEASGNTASDLTANSNQGTLVNGVQRTVDNLIPVKYQPSKALYFDGVNDYVNAGTDPSLKVSTNLTLEAWINPQQDSRTRIIVGREGEYLLALSGGDNTIYYAVANTNPGYHWTSTGYTVKSNEWSHIAFSVDNGRIKTYVNGQLVYTYDGVGTIGDVVIQQDEFRTGNRQINGSEFFKGQIDEVRVWNITRTQSEIQANLSQKLSGKEKGLAGYWNFEEPSGQIVMDASANGNHGMLLNKLQRTVANPNPVIRPTGNALYFDGINDYINVGVKPSLEVSNAITIEAWIKPQSQLRQGGGYFVSRQGEYEVSIDTDGTIKWAFANTNPGWLTINTGYAIKTGEWTHVAVSYNNGLVNTYVNGALVHTYEGAGIVGDHPLLASLDEFRIGNLQYGNSLLFKGEIDEVRVWNISRTQAQIQASLSQKLTGKEQGLVGYWNFDEASGDTVNDLTTNGNQGTLINGVQRTVDNLIPVKYQPSKALYFDGVNDYVNVGTDPSLKVSTNLTLEAWINPQQDSRTRVIVGREGEYLLALSGADNTIFYAISNTNPGGNTWTSTGYSLKANEWSHIALSFDNGRIKTYVNGQLVYTYDGVGTIGDVNTQADELRIGGRQWNNSDLFKGQIDEVRVWNSTRTQAEIQANISRKLSGKEKGLAGYWNFEETSGQIVMDASANGNHGMLFNGVKRTLPNSNPIVPPAGKALYFNGVNDSVDLGTWFNYQNFTLEMWVKAGETQVTYADIIDNNHTGSRGWVVQQDANATNHYSIFVNGSPNVLVSFVLTANTWQHLALVKDVNSISVYIDGAIVGSTSYSGSITYDGSQILRLGQWGGGGRNWNGSMDEVRVWNTARTQAEIQANLSKTLTGKEQSLAGYWNFEESTGNTVYDLTSNFNNGTINGAQRTIDSSVGVPQFISDQTNIANTKAISDLQTLRLEITHMTLQAEKSPDKVQQFLKEYEASDKNSKSMQALRDKYFPELNQANTLTSLQTQVNKEISQSQQQFASLQASITQKQAQSAAATSQATWYDQEAVLHYQMSRKSGPTWTEERKVKGRSGKSKTVVVTHVDHDWIIYDTYTQQAASLREQAAKLLKGAEADTTKQNTVSEILKQWQATSNIADQTAITQAQLIACSIKIKQNFSLMVTNNNKLPTGKSSSPSCNHN